MQLSTTGRSGRLVSAPAFLMEGQSAQGLPHGRPLPAQARSPLGPRIQRNAQAESLLSGCTLGPFKCPCNFSNWCLLPSESFQFANIGSGPFASFGLGSHVASYKKSIICRLGRQIGSPTAVLSLQNRHVWTLYG